jgi:hypothetical protein
LEKGKDYTIDPGDGSSIITLQSSYLDSLANGTYVLRFVFREGIINVTVIVNIPVPVVDNGSSGIPPTGDSNNMLVWIIVLSISILGVVSIMISRILRRNNNKKM